MALRLGDGLGKVPTRYLPRLPMTRFLAYRLSFRLIEPKPRPNGLPGWSAILEPIKLIGLSQADSRLCISRPPSLLGSGLFRRVLPSRWFARTGTRGDTSLSMTMCCVMNDQGTLCKLGVWYPEESWVWYLMSGPAWDMGFLQALGTPYIPDAKGPRCLTTKMRRESACPRINGQEFYHVPDVVGT
jgi:hypothetical protein